MKKTLSAILAFLMLVSIVSYPATAAEKATASTLGLELTEGTVSVTNKSDKAVTVRDGMKLYNGHKISTETKSYAYISLDETKVVKLDAVSMAEIIQSGKKLEVDVKKGELFFNVTAPLEDDESLNIRTSTMVTGIRGTSGFIRVISDRIAELYLLSGSVVVTSTDPQSGQSQTAIVNAGEMATSYVQGEGPRGDNAEIDIRRFDEDEVPGFVAQEIKKSEELQNAITGQTELDVPKIIGEADERLDGDQQKQDEQQKEIEQELGTLENEKSVDPLYEDGGDPAPSTGTTVTGGTYTVTGAVSAADLQGFLNTYDTVVIDTLGTVTIGPGESVRIPVGKTLTNNGTINIDPTGYIANLSMTTLNNGTTGHISGGLIKNGDDSPGRAILDGVITSDIESNGPSELTITGTVTGDINIYNGTATVGGSVIGNVHIHAGTTTLAGNITGIVNVDAATVTMTGGIIDGGSSIPLSVNTSGGSVLITGGTVTCTGAASPAVLISGGSVTLAGGVIELTASALTSSAVMVMAAADGFTMNSGIIDGNIGNTVYVDAGATAAYNGGVFCSSKPNHVVGTFPGVPEVSSVGSINLYLDDSETPMTVIYDTSKEGSGIFKKILNDVPNQKITFDLLNSSADAYLATEITVAEGRDIIFDFADADYDFFYSSGSITNYGSLTLIGEGEAYAHSSCVNTAIVTNYGTLNLKGGDSKSPLKMNFGIVNSPGATGGGGVINVSGHVGWYYYTSAPLVLPSLVSTGSVNVGDGGVLVVDTENTARGLTVGGNGLNLGSGGSLTLYSGFLTNSTALDSCVTGADDYMQRISVYEGFTINDDDVLSQLPELEPLP